MKIDVRTPDGQRMAPKHATLPLGSALRIAPAFVATAVADDIGVETTIQASYTREAGRYRITSTTHHAVNQTEEITPTVLRQVRLGELLSAAVPYCVAVDFEGKQRSVHYLLAKDGRVVPKSLAALAVAAGPTADTLGLVHLDPRQPGIRVARPREPEHHATDLRARPRRGPGRRSGRPPERDDADTGSTAGLPAHARK